MKHTLAQLKSGELVGVKRINISCGLNEFPPEIYSLAEHLEILDLSNNCLSQLPDDIISLKKLKVIFLGNNKFTVFPTILSKLPSLTMISFKSNQIHTVPENAFPKLLRWLILTDNKIKKLPKSIGDCAFLQKFPLAGNLIEKLPSEMENCKNLELLRISSNKLKTIPDWLFSLPKLSWIAFGGNPVFTSNHIKSEIKSYHFSDFKLDKLLGQGASGIISKANWISKNKDIAIKVFKGEVTSDGLPEDEMKVSIAAGNHKNLIPILGKIKGHPEGKDGLLMELISPDFTNLGNPPSLKTCTRDVFNQQTTFTESEFLKIAKNLASVLFHLHSRGINHGDVYAHNILINEASEILFGDFGAASFYDVNYKLAHHIQRVEVRAFGCFLEDIFNLVDNFKNNFLKNEIQNLIDKCQNINVDERPSFNEIVDELNHL